MALPDIADGADGVLPVLDLDELGASSLAARRGLAAGPSGTVVHEAGHFLAAAKLGVPADFILFDWSPEGFGGPVAAEPKVRFRA